MSTRKRPDDDFDREIRAHIEIETERLIDEGMSPDAARVAARRRFGNVTVARERFYEAGRLLWLDHLVQDLRCAARNMRRYPVASLVAVLSLAAGIGATTVTLTVRDVIFRKPPPLYQQPEQLSKIQIGSPDEPRSCPSATPFRSPSTSAGARPSDRRSRRTRRSACARFGPATVRPASRSARSRPSSSPSSASRHRSAPPSLPRPPTVSGPPPAILSHRVWQELFDQRADAIGRVFWIDDQAHTVIGVMPERFWFSDMDSPIWTALDPADAAAGRAGRRGRAAPCRCDARRRSRPGSRAASPTTRRTFPPASGSSP